MAHACVRLLAGVLSSCFAARHMELFEHADKIEKAALSVRGEPPLKLFSDTENE